MRLHRLEAALLALFGLTIIALFAAGHVSARPAAHATILGVAALKGRRILFDFIGLRARPGIWRGLLSAWVVAVASFCWVVLLVGSYVRG
ncbi:cytochrome C oxidase subunit IV family protein [Tardiphaga sp. 768_D3_N2_1]|uniref:cytochrome C oxidase subunit IV family protein n=1 Tax=Tardiphaga sp. 768_D3_N2_1 TaxID=3240783 RepID=UPI003F8C7AF8